MATSSTDISSSLNKAIIRITGSKFSNLVSAQVDLRELSKTVPQDATQFYNDFGHLRHDRTGQPVTKLANYQTKYWNWGFHYRYRLAVKSQKVGFSTSCLMEDFQKTVLPPSNPFSTMGFQTLVIGQTAAKAKEHIDDLTKMIKASKKYRPFLIEKPEPELRPTEITKTMSILLRNPYNPLRPSYILGTGSNASGVWSYKRVKHIHMSDPAAITQIDDTELYDAAFSRLAITNGTFNIESPPRGQRGQLWEIFKSSKLKTDENDPLFEEKEAGKFKVMEVPYDYAVQAGVMEESFFIGERERLGPRFGQYYECEFLNPSNTWYDDSLFAYDSTLQLG